MSCCCDKTLDFCKAPVCDGIIDFDILAQVSGIYKLVTDFLGTEITVSKNFGVGDNISFPTNLLNENYQFTANIYDPIGNKVLIRKNLVDYDCFKFRTVLSNNIGGAAPVGAPGAPAQDETVFQFSNVDHLTIPWTPQLSALHGNNPVIQTYFETSPGVFALQFVSTVLTGNPLSQIFINFGGLQSGYTIIS